MKKNYFYLWVTMVVTVMCIGFTSCGDDDDDNSSSTSKAMVGYWNVSTLNYSMVLFDDGVMKGMAQGSNSEITTGNWSFDSQTNTLATSALYKGNNLQWLITMLNTNNWTGVALWNDKNTTYMADNKENELDVYELKLLLDGKWVSKAGNTITFNISKPSGYNYPSCGVVFNGESSGGSNFNIFTKGKDKIFLDEDWPYDKYTIQIINPYSYKNRQVEIVFGKPGTLGVYYFQD